MSWLSRTGLAKRIDTWLVGRCVKSLDVQCSTTRPVSQGMIHCLRNKRRRNPHWDVAHHALHPGACEVTHSCTIRLGMRPNPACPKPLRAIVVLVIQASNYLMNLKSRAFLFPAPRASFSPVLRSTSSALLCPWFAFITSCLHSNPS